MALGTVADVRRKIGWSSGDISDSEITAELEEANRLMDGKVDYPFRHRVVVQDGDETEYQLPFRKVDDIERVLHNGEEVAASNWTLSSAADDTSLGTLDFTQAWVDENLETGDRLTILMYPSIYADIEVALAVAEIAESGLVSASGDVLEKMSEKFRKRAENKVNRVNQKVAPVTAPDHRRAFRHGA